MSTSGAPPQFTRHLLFLSTLDDREHLYYNLPAILISACQRHDLPGGRPLEQPREKTWNQNI
jgi:hypothetical protein